MTTEQKRKILARYVEHQSRLGYDISDLMCRPIKYFNWDNLKKITEQLDAEYEADEEKYYQKNS